MLAKAVAAEAGVSFLAASGSDFIEKYVGVGPRRIRDLFTAARREGRAVIFVDEIDAIGRRRGGDSANDERDATPQRAARGDGRLRPQRQRRRAGGRLALTCWTRRSFDPAASRGR
ncbi:MAG: AAA family ATPase [Chloroflexota bacterium]